MSYSTVDEVAAGFRELSESETNICMRLIEEASALVDITAPNCTNSIAKTLVVQGMVRRALGNTNNMMPIGASTGTISALGYSQSVTFDSSGSSGELYISKLEKKMLGMGNQIGSKSPLED